MSIYSEGIYSIYGQEEENHKVRERKYCIWQQKIFRSMMDEAVNRHFNYADEARAVCVSAMLVRFAFWKDADADPSIAMVTRAICRDQSRCSRPIERLRSHSSPLSLFSRPNNPLSHRSRLLLHDHAVLRAHMQGNLLDRQTHWVNNVTYGRWHTVLFRLFKGSGVMIWRYAKQWSFM